MKKQALIIVVVAGLTWSSAATCLATPITLFYLFGIANPDCISEVMFCGPEALPGGPGSVVSGGPDNEPSRYTNVFNGGYRDGGFTAWNFFFDPSPFTSINSMTLDVDIVGFTEPSGNIDPVNGQIGDYLAIDGVPFAPALNNTDGLDHHTFVLPILSPGEHEFSVWAFEPAFEPGSGTEGQPCVSPNGCENGSKFEGWGGVDFAKLRVDGDSSTERSQEVPAAVPEPASLLLLGSGLLGIAKLRRRYQR